MRALAWDPDLAAHEPAMLDEVNARLAHVEAAERVRWALEHLPGAHALSSSFGAQAAVSLHLVTRLRAVRAGDPDRHGLPVPGDLPFRRRPRGAPRAQPQGLPAVACRRPGSRRGTAGSGSRASTASSATTRCARSSRCSARSAELGVGTWFAGLRRDQSRRAGAPPAGVPRRPLEGAPDLPTGPTAQVFDYLRRHDLPYHPLWHEGYVSIGDWHTTRTLAEAGDAEATRFFGLKRECGLHGLDG